LKQQKVEKNMEKWWFSWDLLEIFHGSFMFRSAKNMVIHIDSPYIVSRNPQVNRRIGKLEIVKVSTWRTRIILELVSSLGNHPSEISKLHSGNQTWLAGKSTMYGGCSHSTTFYRGLSIAMFDYQRVNLLMPLAKRWYFLLLTIRG
jgi:hypothetical protein